jgi:hypothetical protein
MWTKTKPGPSLGVTPGAARRVWLASSWHRGYTEGASVSTLLPEYTLDASLIVSYVSRIPLDYAKILLGMK